MFGSSEDVLKDFQKNKDEAKAMASLASDNKQETTADQRVRTAFKNQEQAIIFRSKIEHLKNVSKQDLEEKAKQGDLAALACLGAWHLANQEENLAHSYFDEVAKSSLNHSNGTLEHMIGMWLNEDPESQAQYFYQAVSKGHYASAAFIKTLTDDIKQKAELGDPAALICLGVWHQGQKNLDLAYECFQKASQSQLNQSQGMLEHAIGEWLQLQNPELAAKYFYQAVSKGHYASATVLHALPDEIVQKEKQNDLAALICLGAWYMRKNDLVRANQYFQAACNSPSNKSNGALEYSIGSWIWDDGRRLKAKYLHLAASKGYPALEVANALISSLSTDVPIYNAGYAIYFPTLKVGNTIGLLHAIVDNFFPITTHCSISTSWYSEEITETIYTKKITNFPKDEVIQEAITPNDSKIKHIYERLFCEFASKKPLEFKSLFIAVPKAKMQKVLPDQKREPGSLYSHVGTAETYFNQYQAELVNFIFSEIIKKGISIAGNSHFESELKRIQAPYEVYYHQEYFTDMPRLIQEKAKIFEDRDAFQAMVSLEKIINAKVIELFTQLATLDKTEYKKPETEAGSTLTKGDIELLNSYINTADPKKDSIHRQAAILELTKAKEVLEELFPNLKANTEMSTAAAKRDTNTAKFLRVNNKIKEVSTKLSQDTTEAGKKAARSWGELIAVWTSWLIGIGFFLTIGAEVSQAVYGTRSFSSDKHAAAKKEQVAQAAVGFFSNLATSANSQANQILPSASDFHKPKPRSNG